MELLVDAASISMVILAEHVSNVKLVSNAVARQLIS
jgi:hypothetical protein